MASGRLAAVLETGQRHLGSIGAEVSGLSTAPTGAVDDVTTEILQEREGAARRRHEAMQPPIYTLEPDPFSVLVHELAKRLAPDPATIAARSAETLCAQVHQACRELATLGKLPGQAVDAKYDCYADPNGDVWKAAHVIFGVDPTRFEDQDNPMQRYLATWRENFRYLCTAFDPDFLLKFYIANHTRPFVEPLWLHLWEAVPENRQMAKDWQAWRAHNDWYAPMRSYPLSREEILEIQTRLRDRDAPGRKKLAEQMRNGMNRLHFAQAVQPEYVGAWPRYNLDKPRRDVSHMPNYALWFLLDMIMRQN